MMFSRAGVRVRAPRTLLTPGVADQSVLHWSYRRRYRRSWDRSYGWGHNSQWGTDLRRDFDLGDRYIYNVDAARRRDLRKLPEDFKDEDGMSRADMIELLRHRCITRPIARLDADLPP